MATRCEESTVDKSHIQRYFVTKCLSMDHLKKCQASCVWACNERKYPPQPKDILYEAFNASRVVLIFSVNGCRGWHGYATMVTPPVVDGHSCDQTTEHGNSSASLPGTWHQFKIKWDRLFLDTFGEQCLSFTETQHLRTQDGETSVNKCRNFDELSPVVGNEICRLIDKDYFVLIEARRLKTQTKLEQRPTPFLETAGNKSLSVEQVWARVLEKVEKLGCVILACPFGSQRYNLDTADSDTDMFVVYAARTSSLLGFNVPPHTIKNQDDEDYDYTILEVHRYCELLLAGDPRCVETLFLDPTTVYYQAEEFKQLGELKRSFLTKQCVEKYTRDAVGARGLKHLDKFHRGETKKGADKVDKMFYIVLRLLQNARNIVFGEDLMVYRPPESEERKLLMSVRRGDKSYEEMKAIADGLVKEVESQIPTEAPPTELLEKWLLSIRYRDFLKHYKTVT